VGIEVLSEGEFNFLRDWQLLQRLNLLSGGRGFRRANESPSPNAVDEVELTIDIGENLLWNEFRNWIFDSKYLMSLFWRSFGQ